MFSINFALTAYKWEYALTEALEAVRWNKARKQIFRIWNHKDSPFVSNAAVKMSQRLSKVYPQLSDQPGSVSVFPMELPTNHLKPAYRCKGIQFSMMTVKGELIMFDKPLSWYESNGYRFSLRGDGKNWIAY